MPVIIEFVQKSPSAIRQELGPFRVEVSEGAVSAFDGFQPLTLATRTARGRWVVNGLEGLEFDYFIVLPPREQARAELEALAAAADDD